MNIEVGKPIASKIIPAEHAVAPGRQQVARVSVKRQDGTLASMKHQHPVVRVHFDARRLAERESRGQIRPAMDDLVAAVGPRRKQAGAASQHQQEHERT